MTLVQAIRAAATTIRRTGRAGIGRYKGGPKGWTFTPYPEYLQERVWHIFQNKEGEEDIRRHFKKIDEPDTKYFKK